MSVVRSIATIHPLCEPIKAQINIPGSKSYTNRALIMASLANGTKYTLQVIPIQMIVYF